MRDASRGRVLRLRQVSKRVNLLFRLLRVRPVRQRIVLLLCTLVIALCLRFALSNVHLHVSRRRYNASVLKPENGNAHTESFANFDLKKWLMDPPPHNDTGANIAYFVQVGRDSVDMLPRLFQKIHHARNIYIVHIDAKVELHLRERVQTYVNTSDILSKNVHFLDSEMVTYKGVSMVLNTLAAMTYALRVDNSWNYFINLSGADYPLVSAINQRRLLARPGVPIGHLNFVTMFPQREWKPYSFRIRIMYWDPAVVGHQSASSRLQIFRGMRSYPLERYRHFTFTKAEAWVILSRPFVKFVIRSAYAKKMLLNHLHVRSAPEHYFTDILYNHPVWRQTIVPDAFRKVVWRYRRRLSGQHPYVLDRGESLFSFWQFLNRTRSLFARKFSIPNSALLDDIDVRLSGAVPAATAASFSRELLDRHQLFYRNLANHFDELTKNALRKQKISWPPTAYPPPVAVENSSPAAVDGNT